MTSLAETIYAVILRLHCQGNIWVGEGSGGVSGHFISFLEKVYRLNPFPLQSDPNSSSRLSHKTAVSHILRGVQGDKMTTVIVVILTLFFALGSISPLLITDDVKDIVEVRQ